MNAQLRSNDASLRDRVSEVEWKARVDLAAIYRIIAYYRLTDGIYTHISMRIPGDGNEEILINSFGLMYEETCASNLVKVTLGGDIIEDPVGIGINPAGYVIHSAIHEARPDVCAVLHTHTRAGIAVAAQECGLLPISQHAAILMNEVTYHDFEGVAVYEDEKSRLKKDLGHKSLMILRNHGLLSAGRTPGETLGKMIMLERACEAQVAAQSGGVPLQFASEEALQSTGETVAHMGADAHDREWQAYLRLAERLDPTFKD